MSFTLFVKPISHISQNFIYDLFSEYGEVKDIYIPREYKTKRRSNFAYVKYADKHSAARAITNLNEKVINNHAIEVQWAEDKPKTPQEMIEKKEKYINEKRERMKSMPMISEEELERKRKKHRRPDGPLHNRYFTAVDYPEGVGEEFTPIFQRGLPPVGRRRQFFSWVYVPQDQVQKILKEERARTEKEKERNEALNIEAKE